MTPRSLRKQEFYKKIQCTKLVVSIPDLCQLSYFTNLKVLNNCELVSTQASFLLAIVTELFWD